MSKAVLSFRDIVKEVAQCLVKVKTDPLLLPFFLFARSFGATTAACQNGLLIMSPVNSGHIFTATDNKKKKALWDYGVFEKFSKGSTCHQRKHFAVVWLFVLAFIILQNTWERWGRSARLPCDSQTLHMWHHRKPPQLLSFRRGSIVWPQLYLLNFQTAQAKQAKKKKGWSFDDRVWEECLKHT